ncbi:MAG: hypothetical protein QM680_13560 [Luteolibacter sp.]
MKERPILFSAPMVLAILEGRKTQTRRIVKPQTAILTDEMARGFGIRPPETANQPVIECPHGKVGDRLWVKETWKTDQVWDHLPPRGIPEDQPIYFCADEEATGCVPFDWGKGRPSIFMRRWMSRITLEIASIRVERLDDITNQDAEAEGIISEGGHLWDCRLNHLEWHPDHNCNCGGNYPSFEYRRLWESINGAGSWDENSWVYVIEFNRLSHENLL